VLAPAPEVHQYDADQVLVFISPLKTLLLISITLLFKLQTEIREAWLRLSMVYHPDLNKVLIFSGTFKTILRFKKNGTRYTVFDTGF
jgi:hypothetical protein